MKVECMLPWDGLSCGIELLLLLLLCLLNTLPSDIVINPTYDVTIGYSSGTIILDNIIWTVNDAGRVGDDGGVGNVVNNVVNNCSDNTNDSDTINNDNHVGN